jgi:aspartate aminotransferase, mitochondrial
LFLPCQIGDPDFVKCALQFAYGHENAADIGGRIQGAQALSGTGGLRVFGELLRRHGHTTIAVPNPTWGNHIPIFQNSGLQVTKYRYYDRTTSALDFEGLIADLEQLPNGSCVLLHACAHNPTGMDPTLDQWQQISDLMKQKSLLPFMDCAYQGFASGNAETDAAAIRLFVQDGHFMGMVQSFSKNFGLYGHRVGALSIVADSADEASRVLSQIKLVIRPMYSSPPRHGARIVTTILNDADLAKSFVTECKGMADRIHAMRSVLRTKLEQLGGAEGRTWDHITQQIGMFAFSGLTVEEVTQLRDQHHIYCTMDGRISMAGVTNANVEYIATSIHDVITKK